MTSCSRCIKEARWKKASGLRFYCAKHLPDKVVVVPIPEDPLQLRLDKDSPI